MAKEIRQNPEDYIILENEEIIHEGAEIYLRLDGKGRYSKHIVRDQLKVCHKKGFHKGETDEEYAEYIDDLKRWMKKGWVYVKAETKKKETVEVTIEVKKSVRKKKQEPVDMLDAIFYKKEKTLF